MVRIAHLIICINCHTSSDILKGSMLHFSFFVITEAPKVFLAANLQSGLEVKRGDEIILEAHISGSPYPSITWLRNDEVVRPEDIKKRVTVPKKKKGEAEEEKPFQLSLPERMSVDNHKEGESILSIRDSIRADHGTFTIKVENDHGVAKASCEVNVLGM